MTFNDIQQNSCTLDFCFAGQISYPPGGTFGPRIQHNYQLVIINRGSVTLHYSRSMNERKHILTAGRSQMILLAPGNREYFRFDPVNPTEHLWIDFRFNTPPCRLRKVSKQCPLLIQRRETTAAHTRQVARYAETGLKGTAGHFLAMAVLSDLLDDLEELKEKAERREPGWISSVCALIVNEYSSHSLNVEQLALHAGLSEGHMIREFKKYRKVTPGRFLWNYRVHKALELLENTGWKTGEIAQMTGFDSPYHFSRIVKKTTGLSPRNYRRMKWEMK